jgi:hypothetical protein
MMENSMANILRNVIRNGGMPLSQVNERIETMYLSGRISGEERAELTELMHANANPMNETGDWKAMHEALTAKYKELEARVMATEKALGLYAGPEEGESAGGYPAWEPWDGVSAGYKLGDIVTHGGKVWENMLGGMTNVWEPGAPGVDERYWREVVA